VRPRRRPPLLVEDALDERPGLLPVHDDPVRQELHHQERERIHVRPRAELSHRRVELLGGRIGGEEHAQPRRRARLGWDLHRQVVHRARDPEVEDLERALAGALGEEQVARVEGEVQGPLRVRVGDRVDGGIEERDHLVDAAPLLRPLAATREVHRERLALEPLAHEIRDDHPGGRRQGRAAGDALGDVEVPARQLVVEAARLAEALDERPHEGAIEGRRQVEALDGDRRVDADVVPPVDDAEVALAGERHDAELAVERVPDEIERVSVHPVRTIVA
jgi:hypothetical protein